MDSDEERHALFVTQIKSSDMLYVKGAISNSAAFVGSIREEGSDEVEPAVSPIVELGVVGQILTPDGDVYINELGDPITGYARLMIPKEHVDSICAGLQKAKDDPCV